MIFEDQEKEKISIEGDEKKEKSLNLKDELKILIKYGSVDGFFKGFLMIYGIMLIFNIIYFFIFLLANGIFDNLVYFSILVAFEIIICVISINKRNKNLYVSMGMISALLGPAFLIIKRNGEQLVNQYTLQPKKKIFHFLIGLLLSIGLMVLYIPLTYLGWRSSNEKLWFLSIVIIILLNNSIGLSLFFFKENLRYISLGIVLLPLMGIIPLLLYGGIYELVLYFSIIMIFGIIISVISIFR